MTRLGFLRVAALCTPTNVGNPNANRQWIEQAIGRHEDADLLVFGELTLSGYTCGELFTHSTLIDSCREELFALARKIPHGQAVVVGLPWHQDGKLYNCAAFLSSGRLLGLVPKQNLPTYQEFYEGRWFQSGIGVRGQIEAKEQPDEPIPFGTDLLFQAGNAMVGIEICEDLWVPIAPSALQSVSGANVLVNLSASNETVGKAAYRERLVLTQSGKCIAAYVYASSGPSESTTDLVFGGHCLIAENGALLSQSKRVGTGLPLANRPEEFAYCSLAEADIDLERLHHDRRVTGTIHQTEWQHPFRRISWDRRVSNKPLKRWIDPHPFVPKQSQDLERRCDEVFEIQIAGLAKRASQLSSHLPLVIGVSGGLDSTLALMVASKMMDVMGWSSKRLLGLTMPGFGTSDHTLANATSLMQLLGISRETIDIRPSCYQIFQNLSHRPFGISIEDKSCEELQAELEHLPEERRSDLVFENVQARMRTLLLMSRGFVIGTGDLSESALGWCTYNADHMSMYNVNASVPKTLVRFLVKHVAMTRYTGDVRRVLLSISDTPISPELLPLAKDKSIHQNTEATVGPYELHDFFLYHLVRTGASPEKIFELACCAQFDQPYTEQEIRNWLGTFLKRFFQAQFKRSCVPDGPKVGTVSLSPRGDWRMPSDADPWKWISATGNI